MKKMFWNTLKIKSALILFFCGLTVMLSAQNEKVQWLTWEEALEKTKYEKRKIFVDVYTDWCGWCKRMDKATFQKPHIAKYINEHYYPIKFNAEQKEDINFNGKEYEFVSSGRRGYHQLAAKITHGKLSYPTIVFLDEEQNVLQPIPGFQDPKTFEVIMTFFAEDHFQTTPWQKYQENYSFMEEQAPAVPVKGK